MTKVETTESDIAWEPQVGQRGTKPRADTVPLGSFGAEFRELARQRRFVRASNAAALTPALDAPSSSTPLAPEPTPLAAPVAGEAFAHAFGESLPNERISDDAPAMLAELARMSDRLVDSREALATAQVQVEHLTSQLADANGRLMAARALVQDAQHATRQSAERSAWLEGRCDTLQEALELAVNASVLTRWKWRRQARAAEANAR